MKMIKLRLSKRIYNDIEPLLRLRKVVVFVKNGKNKELLASITASCLFKVLYEDDNRIILLRKFSNVEKVKESRNYVEVLCKY